MSITTKKGDCGKTSLLGSRRVSKDDIRIDACGVLDELCSFLGLSRSSIHDEKTKKIIEENRERNERKNKQHSKQ